MLVGYLKGLLEPISIWQESHVDQIPSLTKTPSLGRLLIAKIFLDLLSTQGLNSAAVPSDVGKRNGLGLSIYKY